MSKTEKKPSPKRKSYMLLKDVQPIRTQQGIEDMKWALKTHCSMRDYMIFVISINSGLRVGDIVKITIAEVYRKQEAWIREGKTGKKRLIRLKRIYDELNAYIDTLKAGKPTQWLFPSRKGDNHIKMREIYRHYQKAADFAGLGSVGCHTGRKTFGYWHYKKYNNIALLQRLLNHSHPSITLGYIGISDDEIRENLDDFYL